MKSSFPNFSVQGFNVLITGATGHLGREIVLAFVDGGANVFINGRDLTKLKNLQDELSSAGKNVFVAPFDVTSADDVSSFFQNTKISHLNVIINNAYAGGAGGLNSTKEDFLKSYDISVASPFSIIKSAHSLLKAADIAMRVEHKWPSQKTKRG